MRKLANKNQMGYLFTVVLIHQWKILTHDKENVPSWSAPNLNDQIFLSWNQYQVLHNVLCILNDQMPFMRVRDMVDLILKPMNRYL